jgi:hypothetical protein
LPVAVVNRTLAKELWPRQDPLGKRVRLLETHSAERRGPPPAPGPWLTVVGVVPDILQDDESLEISPVIYMPFRQRPQSGVEVMLRTRVPLAALGDAIRREVQAVDEGMAVRSMRSLDESLWFRNWRYRIFESMFAIFAAIALALASAGSMRSLRNRSASAPARSECAWLRAHRPAVPWASCSDRGCGPWLSD